MKYNKSEIMKNAWATKKANKEISFSDCLRRAWASAKSGVKFVDHMTFAFGGWEKKLNRWTKYGKDRVYICRENDKSEGYVDLVNKTFEMSNRLPGYEEYCKAILAMQF